MSSPDPLIGSGDELLRPATRRRFLAWVGIAGGALLLPGVFSACGDPDDITRPGGGAFRLDLSSDAGLLNYLYALEQADAAFYTAALTSPGWGSLDGGEQEVFSDLQKHEEIHRALLGHLLGSAAIPPITFRTSTLASMTASADALLASSRLLEDTGVSAYDGVGQYLSAASNLVLVRKIASVEARHAAAIRDMVDQRSGGAGRFFAGDDIVDSSGLDTTAEPDAVLAAVLALNLVDTASSQLVLENEPRPVAVSSGAAIQDALDFLLTFEIFSNEFYKAVLGRSDSTSQNDSFAPVRALVVAAPTTAASLDQIQRQEAAHVSALARLGATNALGLDASSFDFTGGRGAGDGPFAAAATDVGALLELAQAVEDVGARAYAGQLGSVMADGATLEVAMRIHSVEGRHAARLRRIRRQSGAAAIVRLSGTIRGGGASAAGPVGGEPAPAIATLDAIYSAGSNTTSSPSEASTTQAGTDVASLAGQFPDADAGSEAFDEPLDRGDVVAIVQRFIGPAIS